MHPLTDNRNEINTISSFKSQQDSFFQVRLKAVFNADNSHGWSPADKKDKKEILKNGLQHNSPQSQVQLEVIYEVFF